MAISTLVADAYGWLPHQLCLSTERCVFYGQLPFVTQEGSPLQLMRGGHLSLVSHPRVKCVAPSVRLLKI